MAAAKKPPVAATETKPEAKQESKTVPSYTDGFRDGGLHYKTMLETLITTLRPVARYYESSGQTMLKLWAGGHLEYANRFIVSPELQRLYDAFQVVDKEFPFIDPREVEAPPEPVADFPPKDEL